MRRAKVWNALLAVLIGSVVCQSSVQSQGGTLIVFGDSLSDTGNLLAISNGEQPASQYYFQGRSSDGPIWVDHLQGSSFASSASQVTAPPIFNYAVGGATACSAGPTNPSSLADQVSRFLSGKAPHKDEGMPPEKAIKQVLKSLLRNTTMKAVQPAASADIIVMIGGNDYLGMMLRAATTSRDTSQDLQTLPELVVNCTMDQIKRLVSLIRTPPDTMIDPRLSSIPIGPIRNLLISSLPPVDVIPAITEAMPPLARANLQHALQAHDSLLQQAVRRLAVEQYGAAPRVGYFDLYTATMQIRNAVTSSGNMDVTDSCLQYGLAFPALRAFLTRRLAETAPMSNPIRGQGSTRSTAIQAQPTGFSNLPHDSSEHSTRKRASITVNGSSWLAPAASKAADVGDTTADGGMHELSNIASSRHQTANLLFSSITGTCDDPEDYFFYDAVHPSSGIHRMAAVAISKALGALQKGQDSMSRDVATQMTYP